MLEDIVTWLQGIGEGIIGEEERGTHSHLTSNTDLPWCRKPDRYAWIQTAYQRPECDCRTCSDEYFPH